MIKLVDHLINKKIKKHNNDLSVSIKHLFSLDYHMEVCLDNRLYGNFVGMGFQHMFLIVLCQTFD